MRIRPQRQSPAPLALAILAIVALVAIAPAAEAQTGYIPYFGKNQIRYDNFDWHTYQTDHFEIFYYPEIEPQLERIAGWLAEHGLDPDHGTWDERRRPIRHVASVVGAQVALRALAATVAEPFEG